MSEDRGQRTADRRQETDNRTQISGGWITGRELRRMKTRIQSPCLREKDEKDNDRNQTLKKLEPSTTIFEKA